MIVCSCRAVRCHQIRNEVCNGASCVEDVSAATGAGTGCGCCQEQIAELIEETLEATASPVAQPVAA